MLMMVTYIFHIIVSCFVSYHREHSLPMTICLEYCNFLYRINTEISNSDWLKTCAEFPTLLIMMIFKIFFLNGTYLCWFMTYSIIIISLISLLMSCMLQQLSHMSTVLKLAREFRLYMDFDILMGNGPVKYQSPYTAWILGLY